MYVLPEKGSLQLRCVLQSAIESLEETNEILGTVKSTNVRGR